MGLLDEAINSKFHSLLAAYKDLLETTRKQAKDSVDLARIKRLASIVDANFDKLMANERLEFVRMLVDNDLAPKEWLMLQSLVGGSIRTITDIKWGVDTRP